MKTVSQNHINMIKNAAKKILVYGLDETTSRYKAGTVVLKVRGIDYEGHCGLLAVLNILRSMQSFLIFFKTIQFVSQYAEYVLLDHLS